MLKRILIALGILVLLAVAVLVAVPFLVPKDEVKRLVTAQVHQATGRTLTLGGELEVEVLPVLAVTADDVAIGNPSGMEGELARADELVLELDWLSLLSRKVVVDRFVLERPQVALLVDAEGRANWDFATPSAAPPPAVPDAPTAPAPAPPATSGAGARPAGERGLQELQLSGVEIRDGRISYAVAGGPVRTLEDLDLTLELPGLRQPLTMAGSGRLDGTALAFEGQVGELQALMQGQAVPLRLSLSSVPATLLLDGQLTGGAARAFDGRVEAAIPSLPALLALAGQQPEGLPPGLDSLDLKAQLNAVPAKLALDQIALTLGDLTLAGRLVVEPLEDRPRIAGQLSTGLLDLNALLPEGDGAPAAQAPAAAPAADPAAQPDAAPAPTHAIPPPPSSVGEAWPETPLDTSAMALVDLDLALQAEGLRYRRLQTGPLALALALRDRILSADLSRMALYGGTASAQLNVNARGDAPQFAFTADLAGIEAEPVLTELAEFEKLAGRGDARAALTSSGPTLRAAVANLAGNGAITFRDGAVKGINIAQMLRSIGSGFREPFSGPHQQTDFSELSGSYTISGGVLSNRDLLLKSPLLRLSGTGEVSIIGRTIDYRLTPELAATAAGQGGADRVAGLAVPLLVRGPLEDPAITPDLEGMTVNLLQNPEAAIQQLQGLRDQLPGKLGEILGGGGADGSGAEPTQEPRQAVEDAVRGILGGDTKPADALRDLFNR